MAQRPTNENPQGTTRGGRGRDWLLHRRNLRRIRALSAGGGGVWGAITGNILSQADLQAALAAISAGATAWSTITGTLSAQTDLQAALDAIDTLADTGIANAATAQAAADAAQGDATTAIADAVTAQAAADAAQGDATTAIADAATAQAAADAAQGDATTGIADAATAQAAADAAQGDATTAIADAATAQAAADAAQADATTGIADAATAQAAADAAQADADTNATAITGKQPLDGALTAYVALVPGAGDILVGNGFSAYTLLRSTTFGQGLLALANQAALLAAAGAQASDSDLTAIAALTTTAFGRSVLEAADAAALLALAGGQGAHANLTAIAALTTNAFGLSLLEQATQEATQETIGINSEQASVHFADFLSGNPTIDGYYRNTSGTGAGSRQLWQFCTTGGGNNQGVVELGTGTTATGYISLNVGNNALATGTAAFKYGARSCFWTLSTATDEYICTIGIGNDCSNGGKGSNEICFRYDRATDGVNWQCVTRKSSAETITDSGVAATASATGVNMQTLEFTVNEAGTSVTFQINGIDVATHTTNVPTSRMGHGIQMEATAYTSVEPIIGVDWTRFEITRATPR